MKTYMILALSWLIAAGTTLSASEQKLPQTRREFVAMIRQQSNDIAQLQEKLEAAEKTITRLKREHQLLYHLCRKNKIAIPATISKPDIKENKNFKDSMLLGDIGYVKDVTIVEVTTDTVRAEIEQPIRYKLHGRTLRHRGIWLPDKYRGVPVFLDINGIDGSQIADGIEIKINTVCIISGVVNRGNRTIFVVEKYAG